MSNRLLQPEQINLPLAPPKPKYTCNNCQDTGYAPCYCFILAGAHACPKCTMGQQRFKELGNKWEGPHEY